MAKDSMEMPETTVLNCTPGNKAVLRSIRNFLRENDGQDLAEYCLLTALVALVAFGVIWNVSGGVGVLWGNSNSTLASAGTAVSGSGTGTGGGAVTSGGNGGHWDRGDHHDHH